MTEATVATDATASLVPTLDNNELVLGEFDPAEVQPCALDKLNKEDQDFTHMRHIFANRDQYDLFCMLPGGTNIKQRIIDDYLTSLQTANQNSEQI